MALYLITYDIAEQDREEYEPLWGALEKMGARRVLLSVWIVSQNGHGSESIYNILSPLIKKSDRLLIQEVTRDVHWDRLEITDNEFKSLLRDNARG